MVVRMSNTRRIVVAFLLLRFVLGTHEPDL